MPLSKLEAARTPIANIWLQFYNVLGQVGIPKPILGPRRTKGLSVSEPLHTLAGLPWLWLALQPGLQVLRDSAQVASGGE